VFGLQSSLHTQLFVHQQPCSPGVGGSTPWTHTSTHTLHQRHPTCTNATQHTPTSPNIYHTWAGTAVHAIRTDASPGHATWDGTPTKSTMDTVTVTLENI
jgi:hypothetical protein